MNTPTFTYWRICASGYRADTESRRENDRETKTVLAGRKPRLVCGVSHAIKQSRSHNKQTVTGLSLACYWSQSGRSLVRFEPTPGCESERQKLVHLGIANLNPDILKWKHATCPARKLKQAEAGFQLIICTQQGGQNLLPLVRLCCSCIMGSKTQPITRRCV